MQSIGGGHLEWAAQHQAQTILALAPESLAAQRHFAALGVRRQLSQCWQRWRFGRVLARNAATNLFTQGCCLLLHQATPAVFYLARKFRQRRPIYQLLCNWF